MHRQNKWGLKHKQIYERKRNMSRGREEWECSELMELMRSQKGGDEMLKEQKQPVKLCKKDRGKMWRGILNGDNVN